MADWTRDEVEAIVGIRTSARCSSTSASYDIASINPDTSPRLIEVKTTGLGKHFPLMVTANEVRVSAREPDGYHLYRIFEFATASRLYVLHGSLSERCRLEATQYRARP